MQSFVLAVVVAFVAHSAGAEEPAALAGESPAIAAPSTVPPIPAPGEVVMPVAPLDGPWPAAADADTPSVPGAAATAMPPIPAPSLAASPGPIPAPPLASAVAPIPAPGEVVTPVAPLDGPWPAAADADTPSVRDAAATAVPPIPAPSREPVRPAFDPAGTIHVVQKGDTLWDISDLYLGTPWIWPSIWKDNADIENPHLILPGDKIWVSATEMRKVSDAEAATLTAAKDSQPEAPAPAALAEDVPAVPVPERASQYLDYRELGSVGLVRKKELKGFAQIVGTTEEQVFVTQGDTVFVDLGVADTHVGDQFVIFRTSQRVYDPSNRRPIGYHTEILGWLQVTEVYAESAKAKIRMAYSDFVPGAYLQPRELRDPQIEIKASPPGVEGQLADLLVDPKYRAGGDVVVLNRGSEDGLEVGSPLEVYRPVSSHWKDNWYGRRPDIEIPHEVVAQMIVLSVQPRTAMAYVRNATTELWYGDRFRTVGGPSVEWPEGGLFILPRIKGLLARMPRPKLELPELGVPGVDLPEAVAGWNLPRLLLPDLDGYDPR